MTLKDLFPAYKAEVEKLLAEKGIIASETAIRAEFDEDKTISEAVSQIYADTIAEQNRSEYESLFENTEDEDTE